MNTGQLQARLDRACRLLDELDCSCVIIGGDDAVTTCHRRGVIDLYEILVNKPSVLNGAVIADKVVGKGAAAIMALGRIAAVHSRVMSRAAIGLLRQEGIPAVYDTETSGIINRAGSGPCPVESLCAGLSTPSACLKAITAFLQQKLSSY
ncbi:MAG: DUF1893 domain-containing protein [Muribaculaceae bacterium]|nr:DUF1893 domain-containing protein [Muribaculaceae bacterium]